MSQIKDLGDGYYVVKSIWLEPQESVDAVIDLIHEKLTNYKVEWGCFRSAKRVFLWKLSNDVIINIKKTNMEHTYAEWQDVWNIKSWCSQDLMRQHLLFNAEPSYYFNVRYSFVVIKFTKKTKL